MKIIFMGTPEFAVPVLKILADSGYEIPYAVTAVDKPAGRGQHISVSPVKSYAQHLGIPVLQPLKLKDTDFISKITNAKPDLFVVVAFRMLPEMVFSIPPKGCINLHASLLPHYRGAAPINWAIINGEKVTGLTVFYIEKEIDTGQIINQISIPIGENMTAGALHDAMLEPGAELVLDSVKLIQNNLAVPITQISKSENHVAPKIFPEMCIIDWSNPASYLYNFIRGLSPHPCARTFFNKKIIKIYFSSPSTIPFELMNEPCGAFICINKQIIVKCSHGALKITDIQAEGKKRMSAENFLTGFRTNKGIFDFAN